MISVFSLVEGMNEMEDGRTCNTVSLGATATALFSSHFSGGLYMPASVLSSSPRLFTTYTATTRDA